MNVANHQGGCFEASQCSRSHGHGGAGCRHHHGDRRRRTTEEEKPMTVLEHEKVFREAWEDPTATRYELTPRDVNRVLADRYVLGEPLVFTRAMLWDLEVRKARHPDVFIPYVVAAGSAAAWGDGDVFVRKSMQRLWLDREGYRLGLEPTRPDP